MTLPTMLAELRDDPARCRCCNAILTHYENTVCESCRLEQSAVEEHKRQAMIQEDQERLGGGE